jgi:FMN-dependent oxidoreductase (nitrilotriacetate monooxygenase family)
MSGDGRRRMNLGVLMHTAGQHIAAWRHPDGHPEAVTDFTYHRRLVDIAERGKFDFVFVADVLGVKDWPLEVSTRAAHLGLVFEPMTLMSALAAVTSHIGFVVTASTTYCQPYQVARQFASLDLISGGRAAWNVVTSTQDNEARNFGLKEQVAHDERYVRAGEFVDVVRGLWGTSTPGVYLGDKASGRLYDADKISTFHHEGRYFSVSGILNVPPSPQGRPLIVQAGASGPGRDLAAQVADIVFAATPTMEAALGFRNDIHERAVKAGRDPGTVRVMPGLIPVIAANEEAALARRVELDALIDPGISVAILSSFLGEVDLSPYPIDGPLPPSESLTNRSQWNARTLYDMARNDGLTIRQMAARVGAGMTHLFVHGSPGHIADTMQIWFESGACDGFLVSPLVAPSYLQEFVDEVLPILQQRGLFREEYEGSTLRDNLGLAV